MPTDQKSYLTMRLAILLPIFAAAAVCAPIVPVSTISGEAPLTFESSGESSWTVHPNGYRAEVRSDALDIALPSGQSVRLTLDSANAKARAIPSLGKLRYESVLPGIDLLYYGNHQRLEFDYVVAPGASPSQIRLRAEHASDIQVGTSGQLTMFAGDTRVELLRPHAYQGKEWPRDRGIPVTLSH